MVGGWGVGCQSARPQVVAQDSWGVHSVSPVSHAGELQGWSHPGPPGTCPVLSHTQVSEISLGQYLSNDELTSLGMHSKPFGGRWVSKSNYETRGVRSMAVAG